MRNSIVVASRGRNPDNPSDCKTKSNGTFVQRLEVVKGGVCLHQTRNELGKRVRKEYENGSREHGGRGSMQAFVPRVDCKS